MSLNLHCNILFPSTYPVISCVWEKCPCHPIRRRSIWACCKWKRIHAYKPAKCTHIHVIYSSTRRNDYAQSSRQAFIHMLNLKNVLSVRAILNKTWTFRRRYLSSLCTITSCPNYNFFMISWRGKTSQEKSIHVKRNKNLVSTKS